MTTNDNPESAEPGSILWISKTPEELRAEIAALRARLASAEAERDAALEYRNQAMRDERETERELKFYLGRNSELLVKLETAEAALKTATEALVLIIQEGQEAGFVEHEGACQGRYGGEDKCGFFAWEEHLNTATAALKQVREQQGGDAA